MKMLGTIFFSLLLILLMQGVVFSPVEAALGDVCTSAAACAQPSGCVNNYCTGPCTIDSDCQGSVYLQNVGWNNAVCIGDGSVLGGSCAEAPPEAIPPGPQSGGDFINIVENITDWLFIGLLLLAVVFVILAARQFITGGGDPSSISEARMKLVWVVVAIIVATLAKAIPVVVRSIIGA